MDNTRKFILILGVLENGKIGHMYANCYNPISTCIIYELLLKLECYIDENIKGVCCKDEMFLVNSTSDDRHLVSDSTDEYTRFTYACTSFMLVYNLL